VIPLLVSATTAFVFTILLTPVAIATLRRHDIGQFIQEEVSGHHHKRGTPTMGGLVIVTAVLIAYLVGHIGFWTQGEGFDLSLEPFSYRGWLAIGALFGMGLIGFLDDFSKYVRAQNLGLSKRWKFAGQLVVAAGFAWGAVAVGVSTELSFTRGIGIELGPWLYGFFVLLMLTATANAVNLTDGLDGLVAGSGSLVFGAYVLVAFWQFRNFEFYGVTGALDLAIVSAAVVGAAAGFLWWNAAPARIFMGDTGSQAIGGVLAALALLTNTHLLLLLVGGLYVLITASVILQVFSFRVFGRRIFRMAPIHHHFELAGWPETTVIIRFWIVSGMMVAAGVGIFYGDWAIGFEGELP